MELNMNELHIKNEIFNDCIISAYERSQKGLEKLFFIHNDFLFDISEAIMFYITLEKF